MANGDLAKAEKTEQVDRRDWQDHIALDPTLKFARALRNSKPLGRAYWWLAERIFPIVVVVLFLLAVVACIHHLVYQAASAAGVLCAPSSSASAPASSPAEDNLPRRGTFETKNLCWASGLQVKQGLTYEVALKSNGDWFDQVVRTDVSGFATDSTKHFIAWPLKRSWSTNWFQPILRIGAIGDDEYVMTPDRHEPVRTKEYKSYAQYSNGPFVPLTAQQIEKILTDDPRPDAPTTATIRFTAAHDGELFLYVNDALPMVPFSRRALFYANNSGTGTLTVRVLSEPSNR